MPIWELQPVDPKDTVWTARSTYRGRVVIRSASEERARQIAMLAFNIAGRVVPGKKLLPCPWDHYDMARCRKLVGSGHDEDGPEAILDPAIHEREWRH